MQPVLEITIAFRLNTPKSLRRILLFTQSIARYWGTLVTGGLTIGVLGIWQQTGHFVCPFFYWTVTIVAFFVACFKSWNEKTEQLESRSAQMKPPKSFIEGIQK